MDQKLNKRITFIGAGKNAMFCVQSVHHGGGPPYQILPHRMGDPGIHMDLLVPPDRLRGYLAGALSATVGERLDLLNRFRYVAIEQMYLVSLQPRYCYQTFPNVPVLKILLGMELRTSMNLLVREKFSDFIRSPSCLEVFMDDYLCDVLDAHGDQPLFRKQAAVWVLGPTRVSELHQEAHQKWLNALVSCVQVQDDDSDDLSDGEYLLAGDLTILSRDLERHELIREFAQLFVDRFHKQQVAPQQTIDRFNGMIVRLNEFYSIYFPSRAWDVDVNTELASKERQYGGANM